MALDQAPLGRQSPRRDLRPRLTLRGSPAALAAASDELALPEGSAARLRTVAAAVEAAEQDLAERRARAETASPKGFKNVPSGETGTGAFAHQRAPAGFLPCLIGNAAGTVGVAELHGARDRARFGTSGPEAGIGAVATASP